MFGSRSSGCSPGQCPRPDNDRLRSLFTRFACKQRKLSTDMRRKQQQQPSNWPEEKHLFIFSLNNRKKKDTNRLVCSHNHHRGSVMNKKRNTHMQWTRQWSRCCSSGLPAQSIGAATRQSMWHIQRSHSEQNIIMDTIYINLCPFIQTLDNRAALRVSNTMRTHPAMIFSWQSRYMPLLFCCCCCCNISL